MVLAVFLAPPDLRNNVRRSIARGGGGGVASGQVNGCPALMQAACFADIHHLGNATGVFTFPTQGLMSKFVCKCSGLSFGGSIDTEGESST